MPMIDKNVVQMVFDNKQFEQGVAQSTQSLEKLKKGLELDKATASLSNIEKAAHRLDLSGISDGVEKIQEKFSMLGVLGVTAMQRIANAAIDTGTRIVKAISIDNIGAGQQKYQTQTKAVQTIIAATGKPLQEVETVLSDLMKYTDETSYDFSGMVSSIGKFTAAGVDLKIAEKAMEGIANEAARSGAGVQEANRAMYNFAQSLSQGSVKLIDWKSIALANMATKEFKEELIKTAIASGTLTKASDKTGYVMKQTKKATKKTAAEFKKTEVNYKSFESTLSEGWLTSDVLIKTLNRYADTTTEIGKASFAAAKEYLTFGDVMQTIADSVSSGWMRTFKALFGNLDEARNLWTRVGDSILNFTSIFTDARNELVEGWHELGGYNTAVEAASNLWHTFMNIVEGVKQAFEEIFPPITAQNLVTITDEIEKQTNRLKKLFGIDTETEIEETYNVIIDKAKELNQNLKIGDHSDYTRVLQELLIKKGFLDKGQADGIYGPKTEAAVKKLQKTLGVDVTGSWDDATRKAAIAQKTFAETQEKTRTVTKKNVEKVTEKYKETINYAEKINKLLGRGDQGDQVKMLQEQLIRNKLLDKGQADGVYGPKTEAAVKELQKKLGVEVTGSWDHATRAAAMSSKMFQKTIEKEREVYKPTAGLTKSMVALQNIAKGFFSIIKIGKDIGGFVIRVFKVFLGLFKPLIKPITRIMEVFGVMFESLEWDLRKSGGILDTWEKNIRKKLGPLGNFIKKIAKALQGFIDRFLIGSKKLTKKTYGLTDRVIVRFDWFLSYLKHEIKRTKIGKFIFDTWDKIKPIFGNVKEFLGKFKESISGFFKTLTKPMTDKKGNPVGFIDRIKEALKSFKGVWDWIKKTFGNLFGPKDASGAENSFNLLEGIGKVIKKVIKFIKTINIAQLALFATGLIAAFKMYKRIKAPMDVVTNIAEIPKKISKAIGGHDSRKWLDSIGEFAKNIGIGVALLAASVFGIAQLDQGKAWSAVGVVAALIALVGAFAFGMKKLKLDSVNVKGIIKFTIAVLLLTNSVVQLAKLPFDKMMGGLLGLTILLTEMIAFSKLMKGEKFQVGGMTDLGAGINLMVSALSVLSKMDTGNMIKGLVGLAVLMTELGVFLRITNKKEFKAGPGAMIGIGTAVLMMALSLKVISKLDWGGILKGLVGLGAILLELGLFMRLTSGFGSSKGLLGMVGIGIAVLLIAKSLEGLAKLSVKGIIKGIVGLGAIFLEIAIFMKLISERNALRQVGLAMSMVGIGVALSLIVASLRSLAKLKTKSLVKGIIGLGLVFIEIAAFMRLIRGRRSIRQFGNALALIGIAAAINLFVVAIAGLSMIKPQGLVKGIAALGAVFLEIGIFMKMISGGSVSLKAIPMLIAIAGSLLLFGLALLAVSKVPWSTIAAFGVSFGIALSSISTALAVLSKIPITGALTAVANLDIFIANLALVLGAFAGLQKLTGGEFGEWMRTGAEVIGETIGGFIHGIMSGINKDKAPKDGKSLAEYIKEFIGQIKSIIPDLKALGEEANGIKKQGLKKIADAMGQFVLIAGEILVVNIIELLNRMVNFVDFNSRTGNGVKNFICDLKEIVPYLVELSQSKGTISIKALKNITNALAQFVLMSGEILVVDFLNILDKISDFVGKIFGQNGLINFINKIKMVYPVLQELSQTKGTINIKVLKNLSNGLAELVSMSAYILAVDFISLLSSIPSFITGSDPLIEFIDKLVVIGPKLANLSQTLKGEINVKVLKHLADGLDALSLMATASLKVSWQEWLRNIVGFINGKDSLVNFVDTMIAVAPKLQQFGDNTGNVNIKNIENAAGALGALADVANKIPATNGILQDIVGEQDIGTFGDRLEALGKGIASFATKTNKIPKDYSSDGAVNTIKTLSDVESELTAHGGVAQFFAGEKDLGTFGASLAELGTNFKSFADNTAGIDAAKISNLAGGLQAISDVVQSTPDFYAVDDSFQGLQHAIDLIGYSLDYSGLEEAGEKIVENMKTGVEEEEDDITTEIDTLVSALVSIVEGYYEKFKSAGKYIDEGIRDGISANLSIVTSMAEKVANDAYIAAKNKLGIASPSKKGEELGKFFDLGIENGLKSYSDRVGSTSTDLANNIVSSAKSSLLNLNDVISSDVDSSPKIRPVLDASNFRSEFNSQIGNGIGSINTDSTVEVSASFSKAQNLATGIQSDINMLRDSIERSNIDLATKFDDLNEHLNAIDQDIMNMRLYLDGDSLVGGIIKRVDSGLARRRSVSRRSN